MEEEIKLNNSEHKDKVHGVLAHSYSAYFACFLVGVLLDLILKLRIFDFPYMQEVGIVLIILASILILWAQKTSRNLKKETLTKNSFLKGPYVYTRSPTHWGLFFLTLGFGIMTGAVFVVISTIISHLISRLIYLRKEEMILEKKYGAPYLEYKKSVYL